MVQRARNSNGFSLIELMIAIVIIMISMLAVLSATITAIQANTENEVRNLAIRLTNQTAEALLSLPINDAELDDTTAHARNDGDASQNAKGFPPVVLSVRGFRQAYVIEWSVTSRSANIKEVVITVKYTFRNRTFSNTAFIYKHATV